MIRVTTPSGPKTARATPVWSWYWNVMSIAAVCFSMTAFSIASKSRQSGVFQT